MLIARLGLRRHKQARGFTIVELLIVIAVIGILATLILVAYNGVTGNAVNRSVQSDADTLDGLETQYGVSNNTGGEAWYSGNGVDANLAFTPTKGNIVDVVTNSTDYCIRIYNPNSSSYKTLTTAYTKGSSSTACTNLPPSSQAIAATITFTSLTWTQQTGSGSDFWGAVASSSDGTKLLAAGLVSYLYTSTDSGVTWTKQTSVGTSTWVSVASSSDGTKLVALSDPGGCAGYVYTSSNSGSTWTKGYGPVCWHRVTSSSDGTMLAAVSTGGYVYTSSNSGSTWTSHSTSATGYTAIASSSDGTHILATDGSSSAGYIYSSTNSGATWTTLTSAGSKNWTSIAMSSDGTKIIAADDTGGAGYIYTSTDSGATWTQQTAAGNLHWTVVTSSSDGTKLSAAVYNGNIYTSVDGGVTWVKQTALGTGVWLSGASSSDGSKLIFGSDSSSYLWTGVWQ